MSHIIIFTKMWRIQEMSHIIIFTQKWRTTWASIQKLTHGRRNRGGGGAQGARAPPPPIILPNKIFNGQNALELRKFEHKMCILTKFSGSLCSPLKNNIYIPFCTFTLCHSNSTTFKMCWWNLCIRLAIGDFSPQPPPSHCWLSKLFIISLPFTNVQY